jgi:MIP family channel proteins
VAELIGTFVLVLFVTMILAVSNGMGVTDWAVIGLVHAFVLMTLVQTLGGTSGAHFNPAVTTALAAIRKISPSDAVTYICLQLTGGILGTLVTRLVLSDEGKPIDYGATKVSDRLLQGKPLPALVCEIVGTFVLMWAIMGVAVNERGARDWAGLTIGAALGLAVMVFGPLSGGSFNPARSLGPAVVGSTFQDFWIYVVGPLVGALLAAFGYRALVLSPQHREGVSPVDKLA